MASDARALLTLDTHFIRDMPSKNGTPALAYGAQFTRYNGPEGIVIDIAKHPMYDDRTYCKRSHPAYPGIPIDSFRMDFLDFGSFNGEGNIKMLTVKDTYTNFYVSGSYTPMGPVKSGQAGSAKAGYSLHTSGTAGLMIADVTRCSSLIFDTID